MMKYTFEIAERQRQAAEKLGMNIINVMNEIDTWNPTTCVLDELHLTILEVEALEKIGAAITRRADYLRGVMAGRVIHECSKTD